jgi:CRP-like cAMP-binding protein
MKKIKKEELPKGLEFAESNFDFVTQEYKKGTTIFEEGTKPIGLFYVKTGSLNIYRKDNSGKDILLREVNAGQFSGYNDLINNKRYTKRAEAREDSILYFVAKKDFMELMYSDDIKMYFFKLTSIDLNQSEEALITGTNAGTIEGKNSDTCEGETKLSITMPELVNLLGSTAEQFIRVLSDLNNKNVLAVRSSMITMPEVNRNAIIKHLKNQILVTN